MRQLISIKAKILIKADGLLNRKQGLTLIEVIISSLILALSVGCVLFVFSSEKGAVEGTSRKMQAANFARQKLEVLRNQVRPQWDNPGELLEQTDPGWTGWENLSGGELGSGGKFQGLGRRYKVRNIDADGAGEPIDYKEVTVVVDWDEP
ncbi:MAG: type II secretion system protein [Candidatus Omnitrophica bacterium]|nr:type II secretion system protein [Candidatus Omnitrophota bacterium]